MRANARRRREIRRGRGSQGPSAGRSSQLTAIPSAECRVREMPDERQRGGGGGGGRRERWAVEPLRVRLEWSGAAGTFCPERAMRLGVMREARRSELGEEKETESEKTQRRRVYITVYSQCGVRVREDRTRGPCRASRPPSPESSTSSRRRPSTCARCARCAR